MKRIMGFIKATVAGGLVFLVPLVVFALVLGKAFTITRGFSRAVLRYLPVQSAGGPGMDILLSVAGLVAVCFAAGLLARTFLAGRAIGFLEYRMLERLPGYIFMKRMGESMVGYERTEMLQVVLARIEEAWQIGFLMEKLEGGHAAVYIPDAPRPWTGSLYFVSTDRIRPAGISPSSAMKVLRELGIGSKDLMRDIGLTSAGEA